jgi:hypothetical protein
MKGVGQVPEVQTHGCPPLDHPETWLPASAWEDQTYRPFVPATFAVCLDAAEADVLPATAADIFVASPNYEEQAIGDDCRAVATPSARTIAGALQDAGAVPHRITALYFDLGNLGSDGSVAFLPVLPHGASFWDGG